MTYQNTLIQVAEDCPALTGTPPRARGKTRTIAQIEFSLLSENPYTYDHSELAWRVHEQRCQMQNKQPTARDVFLAKPRPCMRASPLTKKFGWGAHYNALGKIAILDRASSAYKDLLADENTTKLKAMRTKRA